MITTRPPENKQDATLDEPTEIILSINPRSLKCPITLQVFFEPVVTSCHHTFEKTAIKKWYKEKGGDACCPTCRKPFKSIHESSDIVDELLNKTLEKYPALNADRYCDPKLFDHHLDFTNHERLRKLVQLVGKSEKLNDPYDFEYKGYAKKHVTRLYQLLGDPAGVKLICNDRQVVAQIDEKSLNTPVISNNHMEGSVLLRLVSNGDGLALLESNSALLNKVTAEGLNTIFSDGMSVLFHLVINPRGVAILDRDERLRNVISDITLNKIATTGFYKNDSPGTFLLSTGYGRAFLEKYPKLKEKIRVADAKPQMAALEINDHVKLDKTSKSASLGMFASRPEQTESMPLPAVPSDRCVIL